MAGMFRLGLFLILLFSALCEAKVNDGGAGSFEVNLGQTTGVYTPVGATPNTYTGYGTLVRFNLNLWSKWGFEIATGLDFKFTSLSNSNVAVGNSESSISTGVGPGIKFLYRFIYVGADFYFMGTHDFLTGNVGQQTDSYYTMPSFNGGLYWQMGTLGVGVSYDQSTVTLASSQFRNSKSTTYAESEVGVFFIYVLKGSKTSFFKALFN